MKVYADTNFYVWLYLLDADGEATEPLIRSMGIRKSPPLPMTWLLRLELANALERLIFESQNGGQWRITPEAVAASHAQIDEDVSKGNFLRETKFPQTDMERQAREITLRHTAKRGFRTYDILHVATALTLRCDTFWSFDEKACHLAKLAGLKTN